MKYIKYTNINKPVNINGVVQYNYQQPQAPDVVGLEYCWAKESEYPTPSPELFGTCPDSSSTDVKGVLEVMSEQDWNAAKQLELYVRCSCPTILTAKQLRLALLETELLDRAEIVISTLPKQIQIAWEYDTHINRKSQLFIELGKQLGLFESEPEEPPENSPLKRDTHSKADKIFILGYTL